MKRLILFISLICLFALSEGQSRFPYSNTAHISSGGSTPAVLTNTDSTIFYGLAADYGGVAGTWDDLSGNGNDLIHATTPPTMSTDSIYFDGDNDQLAITGLSEAQPYTMFFVIRNHTFSAYGSIIRFVNTGEVRHTSTTPGIDIYMGGSSGANTDLAIGDIGLLTVVVDGNDSYTQINDETAVSGTNATTALNQLVLSRGDVNMTLWGFAVLRIGNDNGGNITAVKEFLNDEFSIY